MDTYGMLLKEASDIYLNRLDEETEKSPGAETGFRRIWYRFNGLTTKKILTIAGAVAAILILVTAIGTAASEDWDDSVFGALRRLINTRLDMNEFSVSLSEIDSFHIDKVGFILSGDEYSTVPTVKELLIHGWKVESSQAATGYYDTAKGPVTAVTGYSLSRENELLFVELCEADIFSGMHVRDCRLAEIIIHVDTLINQSNISDFTVNNINIMDCDISQLDEMIARHESLFKDAKYSGGTMSKQDRDKLNEHYDIYVYPSKGILTGTGIRGLQVEVNDIVTGNIQSITILLNSYLSQPVLPPTAE